MQPDDTLCYCFHVTQRKVTNFLRVHRPRVASQLAECGSAGTGCGWCVPFLKKSFRLWAAQQLPAAAQPSGDEPDVDLGVSASEYAQSRAAYIRAGRGKPAPGAIPLPDESTSPSAASSPAEDKSV